MIELAANAAVAMLPVLADGVRGIFNRVTGGAGAMPANVDEVIALEQASTERLKALAELEQTGDTYKWVNAIKSLQRPFAIALIIGSYGVIRVVGLDMPPDHAAFAQMAAFYLFGERTNHYGRRVFQQTGQRGE